MITVHAGQCGNQLGYCLLDSLYDHLTQPLQSSQSLEERDRQYRVMNHYFKRIHGKRSKWVARSVCIDTEPKVIHDCVSRAEDMKKWFLNDKQTHYEHGGAGNNWARGYQLYSGNLRDSSMNSIRSELEEADVSPTILIIHSIGGGTGSGLGTKISEEIYDEFSDVCKMNLAVMPYHFGEVVVQHYNSVLCLSKVAEVTDAVLLFENEIAQDMCVRMHGITRPSLYHVNKAITGEIIPALIPKHLISTPSLGFNCNDGMINVNSLLSSRNCRKRHHLISQDIAHLCSHSNYKFLSIYNSPQTSTASVPFTYDSWSTVISSLQRMSSSGSFLDRKSLCRSSLVTFNDVEESPLQNIATSLVMHGPDAKDYSSQVSLQNSASHCQSDIEFAGAHQEPTARKNTQSGAAIAYSAAYPSWVNNCQSNGAICYSEFVLNGYQRSACLLANGQNIIPSLQRPMTKGANMFRSGAYVHQYESCGLETDDFVAAFRNLGSIINGYVNISK